MPKSKNNIRAYWNFLIGDAKNFTLESRVFHSFSIIVLLICTLEVLINVTINFYESAIICVVVFLVHGSIFFLSRIKNNLRVAILLTGFECNIFLGITYFINGGTKGPIMLFFISTLFLMSSISKVKQVKFWVLLNVFTAVSIGIIEYYFPQAIINTYNSRRDLFIDNISTYVVCVVLVSLGIYNIKSAYSKQSKRLKENSIQLINSNNEKDKLFSIISHDVKAPLNAIKQYLEFLSEGLLTPQEKSYMEGELLKTTISTQSLLENLLEWSRIQIDGGPISIEYLNLSETLKVTLENIKIMCSKKNITFITDINKDVICFTNNYMIQLVVRNLLNNAIKFTRKEGLIHIGTILEDKHCKIYITDNGVGIAEDKKNEIFSLNVKSTVGTENESGTGLGLLLCKEYMDKLSGAITFESEPNLGTTFYVTMPCKN